MRWPDARSHILGMLTLNLTLLVGTQEEHDCDQQNNKFSAASDAFMRHAVSRRSVVHKGRCSA